MKELINEIYNDLKEFKDYDQSSGFCIDEFDEGRFVGHEDIIDEIFSKVETLVEMCK